MYKLIILLFIITTTVSADVQLMTKYGKYCGKDHYDKYGSEAIDVFDRSCQVHDICCSSQGLLSCYCNEQLYWTISNLQPTNINQSDIKDFILKAIYVSVFQCKNYYLFDEYFYVSKVSDPGFNYLPMRQEEPLYICVGDDMMIFDIKDDDYYNFTHSSYDNPMSIMSLPHQVIMSNTCDVIYPIKNSMKVIYNTNNYPVKFQLIRKDRFRPLIHRGYKA